MAMFWSRVGSLCPQMKSGSPLQAAVPVSLYIVSGFPKMAELSDWDRDDMVCRP